jgi:hypothetical protein
MLRRPADKIAANGANGAANSRASSVTRDQCANGSAAHTAYDGTFFSVRAAGQKANRHKRKNDLSHIVCSCVNVPCGSLSC